jgi:hypothetical protein
VSNPSVNQAEIGAMTSRACCSLRCHGGVQACRDGQR